MPWFATLCGLTKDQEEGDGMAGAVCAKTLCNYIDESIIPGVSNDSLWEKRKRRK